MTSSDHTPAHPRARRDLGHRHDHRYAVAIATCRAVPDLDADGPMLLAALHQAGLDTVVHAWDDPSVDWAAYAVVLVRSTWDYTLRREQFLAWASSCTRTLNPAPVLAWNTDKQYLHDLALRGVPVVPTTFVPPGTALRRPPDWPTGDVVVKPAVSASAVDTGRFPSADDDGARALSGRLHAQGRLVMLQPYLPRVDTEGETALLYLGGSYSHAVRKQALLTGTGTREPVAGDQAANLVTGTTPTPDQLAVADAALAAVPGTRAALAYARVDLLQDQHGAPLVLELELTEPSLFLAHAQAAGRQRLAEHVAAAAAASTTRRT